MSERAATRVLWWLSAFVIFGLGVGCIWWPASRHIAQIQAHSREMYDEANQYDADVRQATKLRNIRARVEADVRRLTGQTSDGAAMASALQLLSDESKRFDVELRSVAPEVAPIPVATSRATDVLVPTSVTLGFRGKFRNVVALLADVPRHEVLLAINDVSLQTSDTAHFGSPTLGVIVHATLYRVRPEPAMENRRVASTP